MSTAPNTGTDVVDGFYEIVARVLQREAVRPRDDYFALGGTSLGVMQILWMVEERFGVRLSPTDFFDAPDLAGLAELVAGGAQRQS